MMRNALVSNLFLALALSITASAQGEDRAQRWLENCDNGWKRDRARFCELRDYTVRPSQRLSVDGGDNGGVSFFGWDRDEVKVVALIQTSAENDAEAAALAKQIRVE